MISFFIEINCLFFDEMKHITLMDFNGLYITLMDKETKSH